MIDSLGVGFIISDLIRRQSRRIYQVLDIGQQMRQRNDNSSFKDLLDMLDVTILGHIVSNRQETVILLSNYLQSLHHVVTSVLIQLLLVQQLQNFHYYLCVHLALLVVDTLLLAQQINRSKHNQTHSVAHLQRLSRLKKMLSEIDYFLVHTLHLTLQVHSNVAQSSQR